MGKTINQPDDEDIIILSSDSESEETPPTPSSSKDNGRITSVPSHVPVSPHLPTGERTIKLEMEKSPETVSKPQNNSVSSSSGSSNISQEKENKETVPRPEDQSFPSCSFNFSTFFGPENSSMPMEDRLASFIGNVQSLTEEKIKLENAERAAKRQYEEANSQLTIAQREISKLKANLVVSQSKLNQQHSSISNLKTEVDQLQRCENSSKSKLRSVTGTLINLQKKMVQVLNDAEEDSGVRALQDTKSGSGETAISVNRATGHSSLTEVVLRQNVENFEKDFETKFSEIEDNDKEIRSELTRTNEMLQQIHAALTDRFQAQPQPLSPKLSYESMEDQEMGVDEPAASSSRSSSTTSGSNYFTVGKKVSNQEDNNKLLYEKDTKNGGEGRFDIRLSPRRHLSTESGHGQQNQNHFACNICSESFFELENLRKHYENEHELLYPSTVSGCTTCGKVFNSIEVYQKHQRRWRFFLAIYRCVVE